MASMWRAKARRSRSKCPCRLPPRPKDCGRAALAGSKIGASKCLPCGQAGHWAKDCPTAGAGKRKAETDAGDAMMVTFAESTLKLDESSDAAMITSRFQLRKCVSLGWDPCLVLQQRFSLWQWQHERHAMVHTPPYFLWWCGARAYVIEGNAPILRERRANTSPTWQLMCMVCWMRNPSLSTSLRTLTAMCSPYSSAWISCGMMMWSLLWSESPNTMLIKIYNQINSKFHRICFLQSARATTIPKNPMMQVSPRQQLLLANATRFQWQRQNNPTCARWCDQGGQTQARAQGPWLWPVPPFTWKARTRKSLTESCSVLQVVATLRRRRRRSPMSFGRSLQVLAEWQRQQKDEVVARQNVFPWKMAGTSTFRVIAEPSSSVWNKSILTVAWSCLHASCGLCCKSWRWQSALTM